MKLMPLFKHVVVSVFDSFYVFACNFFYCLVTTNCDSVRRIISNLYDRNGDKQAVLSRGLIEALFVFVFTNSIGSDKRNTVSANEDYDAEYGKELYNIAPLPVASPSQITINKLSISAPSNRKNIVLLSRKVVDFNSIDVLCIIRTFVV